MLIISMSNRLCSILCDAWGLLCCQNASHLMRLADSIRHGTLRLLIYIGYFTLPLFFSYLFGAVSDFLMAVPDSWKIWTALRGSLLKVPERLTFWGEAL